MNLIIIGFVPHCPGGDTCCTEEKKCHEYEGRCSSDDQCNKGLRCGINNCRKKKGLHYSDWDLNLNWIDNCCEKNGKVSRSIYMFKSFTSNEINFEAIIKATPKKGITKSHKKPVWYGITNTKGH